MSRIAADFFGSYSMYCLDKPLVVEFVAGMNRDLRGRAAADIDQVDDLLPVDRVAQRDAEILVLEDLALHRIGWLRLRISTASFAGRS